MKRQFDCRHCGLAFASYKALKKHVYNNHKTVFSTKRTRRSAQTRSITEPFCPICHKSFANLSNAQRHYEQLHVRPCGYECEKCGKVLSRRERHYCECEAEEE